MGKFSLICLLITRLTGSWIYHYFCFLHVFNLREENLCFLIWQSTGLVIKRLWMWWENFVLQGQLSVLTLILVSVPPLCYQYYWLKWLLFLAVLFGMILGFVTDHFLSVFMWSIVLETYVVFVVIELLCLERVGVEARGKGERETRVISVLNLSVC